MSTRRILVLVSAISIAALLVMVLIGRQMRSPVDQLAETGPPPASMLTAEVTRQELRTELVMRGLVVPADPTEVTVAGGRTITDVVLDVGDEVGNGDLLFEVEGRPRLVLEGEVPLYRDLFAGMAGAEVDEVRAALVDLGYATSADAGTAFDADLAAGIDAWYKARGYQPPPVPDELVEAIEAADQRVDAARQRASSDGRDPAAVRASHDTLASMAVSERDELAQRVGTWLPADEVAVFSGLPRRVIERQASRGDVVDGIAMVIAPATLLVDGEVRRSDRPSLNVGAPVEIILDAIGVTSQGQIAAIAADVGEPASDDAYAITVRLEDGTYDEDLLDQPARLVVTLETTDTEVLAVPVVVLLTQPDGSVAVERVEDDGSIQRVAVNVGLTAGDLVQITPVEAQSLVSGDRVRVDAVAADGGTG